MISSEKFNKSFKEFLREFGIENLKIGDAVKVIRTTNQKILGREGKVIGFETISGHHFVDVEIDNVKYSYPLSALQLVKFSVEDTKNLDDKI